MFDIFAKLLSSVASFLFPLFASYKALKTGDTAQLTPWLMYWVVLACALLVESWTEWFLVWIPFYAYIRFLFLLYLVLPQTQGARFIYEEYIHPRLEENETAIEEFIASAHERLRSAGIAYLKRAIELLKTNVLGMPPSPPTAAAAPEPQTPQSYTQSLLARFTLPSPRWNATQPQPQASGGGLSADFYNLLASAVTSATTTTTKPSQSATATARSPLVIPESIRALGAPARMSFLQSQLERLRMVMSALEEAEEAARRGEGGAGYEHEEEQGGGASSSAARRSISGASVTSGLSKRSRSEGDFEKVEIFGSGDEGGQGGDDDDEGEGVRRRGVPQEAAAGAGGGGWIWGWGGGGGAGGGARSSGVEK